MNKKLLVCICALCVVALAAMSASATTFRTEKFALRGSGSLMHQPPCFGGSIIGGTLSPGTFWMCLDDTGWPSTADPSGRWDYIFAHYFRYSSTPGAEGWTGYFPPTASGEPMPRWHFVKATGDTLAGTVTQLLITIRDYNANGIMEPNEYQLKTISGNMVCYVNYGGGVFRNFCGQGSFSGNLTVTNAPAWVEELYVPSATSASGLLLLRDSGCSVGVESRSWGNIKSLYRD